MLGEIVTGLIEFITEHHDVYKGCALGNFTKTPFPSIDSKVACTVEMIHSDVCGTISHVLLSGHKCYVTFIDDYSRKTWIFFLKTKYQVFKSS